MRYIAITLLLVLMSCTDDKAVILDKNIESIDTTFVYRVRTTYGEYTTTERRESLKVNDTISWGF